jgi:hypothetical protein
MAQSWTSAAWELLKGRDREPQSSAETVVPGEYERLAYEAA